MGFKLLCYIFYLVSAVFRLSYRFRYRGLENLEVARSYRPDQAYCLASWHEHALAGVLGLTTLPHTFLVSQSRDGEFVDFISRRLGYKTVRGSSSKGGAAARAALLEALHQGSSPAFTVDGPRGPRHKAKPGVLKVASEGGALILPVVAVAKRNWVMRSWDQNKIPKPFARIVYQFGEPLEVPPELKPEDFEALLDKLNQRIQETEAAAQKGHEDWLSLSKSYL